jgi:hypothetical protein
MKFLHKKVKFCNKPCNKRVLNTVSWGKGSLRYSPWNNQLKRPEIKRLLLRARRDIGYSKKTNDSDILWGLYKQSRSA